MHDYTALWQELKNKCNTTPASKTWHKMLGSWASEYHSMSENEKKRGKLISSMISDAQEHSIWPLIRCSVSAMNELLWPVESVAAKELLDSKKTPLWAQLNNSRVLLAFLTKTCHLTALRYSVLLDVLWGTWEVCLSPVDIMAHSTHYPLECQPEMDHKYI